MCYALVGEDFIRSMSELAAGTVAKKAQQLSLSNTHTLTVCLLRVLSRLPLKALSLRPDLLFPVPH